MRTAIYKITNSTNGKLYIGITADPMKRWWAHKNQTKKTHTKLYNAFRKYGVDAFSFEVLHWCETREDARELENLVVDVCDTIKNGYNMCPGGGGGIAGPDNPFYGKPLPPEVCAKMSEAAKKRGFNPKTIEKGQAALRLKEKDPEWLAARSRKIAIARKGYKASDETKAKQRAAWVERKKNFPQPGIKKVVCNETGEEFISISAAARYYGLSISVVSADCVKGAPKNPRGRTVTFRYAEKD
jgi:group I intron endonuclease